MTRLFDGMAGLLNGVFGGSVTVTPSDGVATTIQAVFRREPIEVAGDDGSPVLIINPTLKVPQTVELKRGDKVEPATEQGAQYEVLTGEPGVSPADDRFVFYELELVG